MKNVWQKYALGKRCLSLLLATVMTCNSSVAYAATSDDVSRKVNTEVLVEATEQDAIKEVSDVQEPVVETETRPVENKKPEKSNTAEETLVEVEETITEVEETVSKVTNMKAAKYEEGVSGIFVYRKVTDSDGTYMEITDLIYQNNPSRDDDSRDIISHIEVPAELEGYPVKKIGANAFSYCSTMPRP